MVWFLSVITPDLISPLFERLNLIFFCFFFCLRFIQFIEGSFKLFEGIEQEFIVR